MTALDRRLRPVRVTIDATAQRVTKHRQRVTFSGGSFLVPDGAEDVVLEDLATAPAWQRGDVIVNAEHGWTLTREAGPTWVLSHDGSNRWTDDDVAEAMVTDPYEGELQVLRYQAGGV